MVEYGDRSGEESSGTGSDDETSGSDSDDELELSFTDPATSAPSSSKPSTKIKKTSSIRQALADAAEEDSEDEGPPTILSFFKKATPAEHRMQIARENEKFNTTNSSRKYREARAAQQAIDKKRKDAKLRKQRERAGKKKKEIAEGVRNPDGSKKRKVWAGH